MSSGEGAAASEASSSSPEVEPSAESAASSSVPSCGQVAAAEASFELRWEAQVKGFRAGLEIAESWREFTLVVDEDDDSTGLPVIDWDPEMYQCYKYAPNKSGDSIFFEDRNGNVIRVVREWPIVGWPARTPEMHPWLSTTYVSLLDPYEVRVSPGDFPVIN
jgi:hypothetical protein